MFWFSKRSLRKSLVIKFEYIPNSYPVYPTMIIYSHEHQRKWIWKEFVLTFHPPPLPLPYLQHENKKQLKKLQWLNRKNFGRQIFYGEFFPGGQFSWRFFPGSFFRWGLLSGGFGSDTKIHNVLRRSLLQNT